MQVFVGFATAQGSTRGIAESIADRLRSQGIEVQLEEIAKLPEVLRFDAAVLGSAIHSGRWLPEATQVMAKRSTDLRNRPLWLFSVSSVGETSSFFPRLVAGAMRGMRSETTEIKEFRKQLGIRGHRNFAGAVAKGDWGRTGDVFLRGLGGRYGDRRDWADIDAWADQIAAALQERQ
ncbi:hypothetical protein AYO38_08220 [bacterium SCGC AG-212-C10]|nr:hypothetical protein AYO38_08220 [bacterium SCGC AG-212-C10]